MKKRFVVVSCIIFISVLTLYTAKYDYLNSLSFRIFQKFAPLKAETDKIIYISDTFGLQDYNNLFSKLSTVKNSVVLFLPQIFNLRVGDYLENIDPEEIKSLQEDYKVFKMKLAESSGIIPVTHPLRSEEGAAGADPGAYSYFKPGSLGLRLPNYNYLQVNSRRIWLAVRTVGFCGDYNYMPYKVPMLYKFNKYILVNAAIEGIRQYYRLPKSAVTFYKGHLRIGKIIDVPLLSSGEMIVPQLNKQPKVYSLNTLLKARPDILSDKIIIVKSDNNSEHTMFNLGVVITSMLKGSYIKYSAAINYTVAVLLLALFIIIYFALKPGAGASVFAGSEIFLFAVSYLLISSGIHSEFALFTAVNTAVFSAAAFYKYSADAYDRIQRASYLRRSMPERSLAGFIKNNADIQLINTWKPLYTVYISFDPGSASEPENFKKSFDIVKDIIYNKEELFLIQRTGNSDITVVFLNEKLMLLTLASILFEIRETLTDAAFNIILNDTDIYISRFNEGVIITDRKYNIKLSAEKVEKKRYIIVPEESIQKYINILKFQKITYIDGMTLFNIAGLREEKNEA